MNLNISILCPTEHWLRGCAESLIVKLASEGYRCSLNAIAEETPKGDILLALGYPELIPKKVLTRNCFNLVAHASDLPKDRGWSPWVWQIVEGCNELTLSWIDIATRVDSGVIFRQDSIALEGNELLDEIRLKLATAISLGFLSIVKNYPSSLEAPRSQVGRPTYRRRRTPADSELDPNKSIAEQFDKFRVVDNQEYPAYFHLRDRRYFLRISSASNE